MIRNEAPKNKPAPTNFTRSLGSLWLQWSLIPILLAGVIVGSFQFWSLYPERPLFESITLGPPVFHYVILELFVTTGLCQIALLLVRKNKYLKIVSLGLSWLILAVLFGIFFVQFASLHLGNEYITVSALTTTNQIALVATPFLFLALLIIVIIPVFMVGYAWTQLIRHMASRGFTDALKLVLAHIVVTLMIMQSYHLRWMRDLKWEFPAQRSAPAQAFLKTLEAYLEEGALPPQWVMAPGDFSGEDLKTMEHFGIGMDMAAPYPLVKKKLHSGLNIPGFSDPLSAFTNSQDHKKKSKLNVIVIFAESLSARLLATYDGQLPQLTPHISDFAKKALVVKGYVNHAFPTIPALTGTLCSVFPQFSHTDWNRAKAKLGLPPLYCLPKLLYDEGYQTYYLGYSHPRETFFRDQMIDFGFSKTLFYEELSKHYLNESPEHGALGNSDFQMFTSLRGVLEEHPGNTPFFLALSTIETHVGMDVTRRGKKYDQGDIPTLNTFHNFDHEFGRFIDWFESSRFARDTIVILTADHAHPPSTHFAQLVSKLFSREYPKLPFDEIPLIIKDPRLLKGQTLMTQSISLDFAPSVTHLLGIPDKMNHFLGHSLFDLEKDHLPRLGIVDGGRLLVYTDNVIKTEDIDPTLCFKQKSDHLTCKIARGIYYIFHLMTEKKIWDPQLGVTQINHNH